MTIELFFFTAVVERIAHHSNCYCHRSVLLFFLWLWMMEVTRIRQEDCRVVALSTTAFFLFLLICLKARHPDMPSRIQRTATTFSCEAINTQSVHNNDCCAVGHQLLGKVLPLFSCIALLDSVNLHS